MLNQTKTVVKPSGKRPFGRRRHKCVDNIKTGLKE